MVAKKVSEPMYTPPDDGIMELSLMLSRVQFNALEQRARSERMSVAQFLRRMVSDIVTDELTFAQPD